MSAGARPTLILVADDYAMTDGVSVGIRELAVRRRISATSVMTASRHLGAQAASIAAVRDRIAVGLHFDLTLLGPLDPMPRLAPDGKLPNIATLTRRALMRQIDVAEIADELTRQLDKFDASIGFPPDHIDGHQHVHALPIVREAVLGVLTRRYSGPIKPLLRDPGDRLARMRARGRHAGKAAILAALSRGFGAAARAAGFPVNDGFAGVSDFAHGGAMQDFAAAARAPGRLQLVMCHPGQVDDALKRLDPVVARRAEELELLADAARMPFDVWSPQRAANGPPIDWRGVAEQLRTGDAA